MRRTIISSPAFVRAAKKLSKKEPSIAKALRTTLQLLSEDMLHPQLKSHKLKGNLDGYGACSVEHDLRIIFELIQHEGTEAIKLLTLGTHDDVY